MNWQTLITTVLVATCSAYAAWSVMPVAWRRRLAAWAGRPLPASSGCGGGCDGCGSAAKSGSASGQAPGPAVIRIVRQPHRGQHHGQGSQP
jgi:hypothetical protein